jgi:hypothetical protein
MRHPQLDNAWDINWEGLQFPSHNLSGLDAPFMKEELKQVSPLPPDNSWGLVVGLIQFCLSSLFNKCAGELGSTAFIKKKSPQPWQIHGHSIKSCWKVIKLDVVNVANVFHWLRSTKYGTPQFGKRHANPKKRKALNPSLISDPLSWFTPSLRFSCRCSWHTLTLHLLVRLKKARIGTN